MSLVAVAITLSEAKQFVANFHRHNKPPQGGLFAVGVSDGAELVGVAVVGRPISRRLDDGVTAEVTRCCVRGGAKGAASFLYAKCWQAAKALGWARLITYTLQAESGASLRGAGWKVVAELAGNKRGWMNRPGREWQPVIGQQKFRWEAPKPIDTAPRKLDVRDSGEGCVYMKREGARQRGYTRRWELFRAEFLREHPLCTYCAQLGRATPATVVDHIVPHQGDMALFWQAGNHQALCASCHNSAKQREERGTTVSGCGLDGVPLSPSHHWTRGGGE